MRTRVERHPVVTPDGWTIELQHLVPEDPSDAWNGGNAQTSGRTERPPVLFVPGYGMNAEIFRYHPTSRSFAESLLRAGLDPWSVDPRGASTSRSGRFTGGVRIADQALYDVPAAIDHITDATGWEQIGGIGCSLGGTLLYAYAAMVEQPRLFGLVGMGSPLVWSTTTTTRLFRTLGGIAGSIPMRGTRRLARYALPITAKLAPPLLSVYLNPALTRTDLAAELTRTVEDPIPSVNREIAAWMRSGNLHLDGLAITPRMRRYTRPLLVVYSETDGICDAASARSVLGTTGGDSRALAVANPGGRRVGHADLFVADLAPDAVFAPVAAFLRDTASGS